MKDFGEQYLKHESDDHFEDPHLYMTNEVKQELLEMQRMSFSSITLCNLLGVILTAPLQTIVSSLQLSVKPHKQIFTEASAKTTQLAKLNTSLTLQQKRRMELIIRSGGQQKPYVAPVYEGYIKTIKGLYSQGATAFFKGLTFRCFHHLIHFYAFTEVAMAGSNKQSIVEILTAGPKLFTIYAIQSFADIVGNFCHIAENRYILQNNIAEFKVFRNAHRVIQKMFFRKQILTGYRYHLYNNLGEIFLRIPFVLSINTQQINYLSLSMYYLAELVLYPFNTAFKRIVCQHTEIPGMIPLRYSSLGHAIKLMYNEQGILGLYKGFGLHQVSTGLRLSAMVLFKPILDQFSTYQQS